MEIIEKLSDRLNPITRGALDGSLSTLGIVIGAYSAGPEVVIAAGLSGGAANGLSNMFAAVSAEKTEMLVDLNEIENALLKDNLKNTFLHDLKDRQVRLNGLIDGVATIFGALIPVIPFFLFSSLQAAILSVVLTSLLAFFLGFCMARISGRNILYLGMKMAIITVIVAVVSTLVQQGLKAVFRGGLF